MMPSEFSSVKISPEVFDQALPSLNDLRLLDTSGDLVPFIIRQERTEEQDRVEWRDVSVINRIFLPEQHACATLDFGKPTLKNEIKVTLSDSETRGSNPLSFTTNYRRRVMVEGSADGQDWKVIAEDQWLFHVSLPGQEFKIDTIRLPRNDFRYLRLTVYNMSDVRRISQLPAQKFNRSFGYQALRRRKPGTAEELFHYPVVFFLTGYGLGLVLQALTQAFFHILARF